MAYIDDVLALSPDHLWGFDGDILDSVGTAHGVSSIDLTATPLCEDAINSAVTLGTSTRITLGSSADLESETSQRMMCGWFMTTAIQQPPCRIWGEGNGTTSYSMIIGFGNALAFEIDGSSDTLQIASDSPLVPNRIYHLAFGFDSVSGNIRAYVDGVAQLDSADVAMTSTLAARSVNEIGDPAGTVGMGGLVILLVSAVNGQYNYWASWSGTGSDASTLTTSLIRTELFEKGAIPTTTITNQAGLDALANSVRVNAPLCIRVDVVGSISLEADNIQFDSLASIHVQYTGSGTLDWTNTNGSDASIGSVIGGGTINFINPTTLTIDGIPNGAEVRIYDNEIVNTGNNDTELAGIESNIGTTFTYNHSGISNSIRVQVMHIDYEEIMQDFTLEATDQQLTIFPVLETN